jgi:hypothetical protein
MTLKNLKTFMFPNKLTRTIISTKSEEDIKADLIKTCKELNNKIEELQETIKNFKPRPDDMDFGYLETSRWKLMIDKAKWQKEVIMDWGNLTKEELDA